jgi:hypothetical protein
MQDAELIVRLLQTRVIPEVQGIGENNASETRGNIIKIMLELICMENTKELTQWAISLICHWYREVAEWKSNFEKTLQHSVRALAWLIPSPLTESCFQDYGW